MDCLNPVMLKSGIVVPCGKCPNCRSRIRNEWSYRLQIECKYSDRMPLMLTLTYDNDHVPYVCTCDSDLSRGHVFTMQNEEFAKRCHHHEFTLYRPDMSFFLKAYKRANKLSMENFHYFGCGEYGDSLDRDHRPHYHLLFFGDDELFYLFDKAVDSAVEHVKEYWDKGIVHICQAEFSGVHYVTKYVLKDELFDLPELALEPFTVASKGLGSAYFKTTEFFEKRRQMSYAMKHINDMYDEIPFVALDIDELNYQISVVQRWLPDLHVHLSDNSRIMLPRYFRNRIIGSFEHFKDNPFWLLRHLENLRDSLIYLRDWKQYDLDHDKSHWQEMVEYHTEIINKQLCLRLNKKRK